MAKNMQPIVKRCRALGISPAVMGYTEKSKANSNKRFATVQRRGKKSEYATQLNEKQKVKFVYGILEKQFRSYYEKAERDPGITGEVLLTTIERRLDNVIFRLGLATTRKEARQLVNHGHFTVDGKKVNIPSFLVKPGMVIGIKESSKSLPKFKAMMEKDAFRAVPKWLEYDANTAVGKVIAMPARDDIDFEIEEHLIVELYSK